MIKSYRIMLLPNNKQLTRLNETANAARYAYNWTVGKQIEAFSETGKYIKETELRKAFTIHKKENLWLYSISNDATKQAIKDACAAFWRFVDKKKKRDYKPFNKRKIIRATEKRFKLGRYDMLHHPKFKKKNKARPKFYVDCEKIKFTKTHAILEKIATSTRKKRANQIRLAEKERVPFGVKYVNPRVTSDGLNFWISVGVETKIAAKKATNAGIGVDVGINKLAVVSNGETYRNINKDKKVRKLKKRKRRLQRGVSRKYEKKGERSEKTKNIIKREKKLLKLELRLTGIRRNHAHQATNKIIKRKPSFITVEDLNIQGMMKNRHLSRALQEQSLYEFSRQLEYKSALNGIEFRKANRFFPSSKICSICGNKKLDLKLNDRIYKCECGNDMDRDLNAAINLMRYTAR